MHFERILCPIDSSDFSVSAYPCALSVAEYYDAQVVVLHAIELEKYPYADYVGCSGDFADFSKALCGRGNLRTCTEQLDKLVPGTKGKNFKVGCEVKFGQGVPRNCALRKGDRNKPDHDDGAGWRRSAPPSFRLAVHT